MLSAMLMCCKDEVLMCMERFCGVRSWPNGTRYKDGVKVLWRHSHLVWLVFEGSIPTGGLLGSHPHLVRILPIISTGGLPGSCPLFVRREDGGRGESEEEGGRRGREKGRGEGKERWKGVGGY